jgi:hypothetical protein
MSCLRIECGSSDSVRDFGCSESRSADFKLSNYCKGAFGLNAMSAEAPPGSAKSVESDTLAT